MPSWDALCFFVEHGVQSMQWNRTRDTATFIMAYFIVPIIMKCYRPAAGKVCSLYEQNALMPVPFAHIWYEMNIIQNEWFKINHFALRNFSLESVTAAPRVG